jgi:hypothetical protein
MCTMWTALNWRTKFTWKIVYRPFELTYSPILSEPAFPSLKIKQIEAANPRESVIEGQTQASLMIVFVHGAQLNVPTYSTLVRKMNDNQVCSKWMESMIWNQWFY